MTHMKEYARVSEAYNRMAEQARYRPAAPNDGFGNSDLSEQELADADILEEEARRYALGFIFQENTATFLIGVAIPSTRSALVYVIEAARCLCSAVSTKREVTARRLLELAFNDLAGRSSDKWL